MQAAHPQAVRQPIVLAHHQLHGGREGAQHIGQRHQGVDQHHQPGAQGKDVGEGHEQDEEAGGEHHRRDHQDHGAAGLPQGGGPPFAIPHPQMPAGEQQPGAEQSGQGARRQGYAQGLPPCLPQPG